LSYSPQIMF